MKKPTFAPAYVGLYPVLSEIANDHGYALAIHGSLQRDFDLVAVPWADEVTEAEFLIRSIAKYLHRMFQSEVEIDKLFATPYHSMKPHGRRSWCIPIDSGAYLDISVMPKAN